jgi:heat shock protein HslJ
VAWQLLRHLAICVFDEVMMNKRALQFLLLAVVVAGCDENPLRPSDLKEVTWKLESIERAGSPTIMVPDPEKYTLTLGNDGSLTVHNDCNQCRTTYSLDGNTLSVGRMACTLVACSPGSLDGTYSGVLEGSSSIAISDSQLVLRNGTATLRFRN